MKKQNHIGYSLDYCPFLHLKRQISGKILTVFSQDAQSFYQSRISYSEEGHQQHGSCSFCPLWNKIWYFCLWFQSLHTKALCISIDIQIISTWASFELISPRNLSNVSLNLCRLRLKILILSVLDMIFFQEIWLLCFSLMSWCKCHTVLPLVHNAWQGKQVFHPPRKVGHRDVPRTMRKTHPHEVLFLFFFCQYQFSIFFPQMP